MLSRRGRVFYANTIGCVGVAKSANPMLIYFHGYLGFNSTKPGILERALRVPVLAPRYPDLASFRAAIEAGLDACRDATAVVAGISLGGFAAYCVARMTGRPALLINPSLQPWKTLANRASADWMDYCRALHEKVPAKRQGGCAMVAIVNHDDELLAPFGPLLAAAGVDRVIELDRGGHEATNFETEMLPLIRIEYRRFLDRR